MTKFHDYDPQAHLDQAHERATTALNNTLQLAGLHNQQEALLADLVNQHKKMIQIIKNLRLEIARLTQDVNTLRNENEQRPNNTVKSQQ